MLNKLLPTKVKIDPEKVYRAFTGAATPQGNVTRGMRVRGSDPLVTANPMLFFEEGISDQEEHDLWAERFGLARR